MGQLTCEKTKGKATHTGNTGNDTQEGHSRVYEVILFARIETKRVGRVSREEEEMERNAGLVFSPDNAAIDPAAGDKLEGGVKTRRLRR